MAKYKVGDKVLVRDDLNDEDKYYTEDKSDYWYFTKTMECFRGKVVTIVQVEYSYYLVEEDPDKIEYFSDEMFVGLADEQPKVFKVGSRVKNIEPVGDSERIGVLGTVVVYESDASMLVDFDTDIVGHDGGGRCKPKCGWWCASRHLELIGDSKPEPTPKPTPEEVLKDLIVNEVVDLYENACWYCRKGGLVDLYLKGVMAICPSCGRVCNNTHDIRHKNQAVEVEVEPPKRENKPLTTEELRALPDGTRVFTVWLNGKEELWSDNRTCWRTKRGNKLHRPTNHCGIQFAGSTYKAYLEEPERK